MHRRCVLLPRAFGSNNRKAKHLVTVFSSFWSLVVSSSSAFVPNSFSSSFKLRTLKARNISIMNASALDKEISKWCASSGNGKVESIAWAGSSDWASFRKVTLKDSAKQFFVKTSTRSAREMFQGEALGLQAMYECSGQTMGNGTGDDDDDIRLKIPQVHYWGDFSGGSLLIMDFLNLSGRGNGYNLGKAMAQMHLAAPNEKNGNPSKSFGFAIDNTIGGTPQPNPWTKGGSTNDWIAFYRDQRIGHQLQLAGNNQRIVFCCLGARLVNCSCPKTTAFNIWCLSFS